MREENVKAVNFKIFELHLFLKHVSIDFRRKKNREVRTQRVAHTRSKSLAVTSL